ncbi:MAG: flavodoxin family protein, partial [Lachnospiraceae bacterium]|nr:flavodoxin family protein [Lachnospiraceae bacterium]
MKVLVLMGSPRLHGNTAELCKPFMEELTKNGAEVKYIELEKKTILPCKECYACQEVAGEYGCAQKDDMPAIAEEM